MYLDVVYVNINIKHYVLKKSKHDLHLIIVDERVITL
jgi:hypothetical protein